MNYTQNAAHTISIWTTPIKQNFSLHICVYGGIWRYMEVYGGTVEDAGTALKLCYSSVQNEAIIRPFGAMSLVVNAMLMYTHCQFCPCIYDSSL